MDRIVACRQKQKQETKKTAKVFDRINMIYMIFSDRLAKDSE